ncbi:hypothetical protein [Lysinibacillus varians]|uniref:Uncharacterized protein n=1 Tax=Lysinibacillus varians TaxID=1145276 RepID=A0ABY2T468_9BACI|nr:hypothetical protein [Lysinibacillus varians]AHN24404.1 hypothetical protein T479_16925 [Lysinibacillus varians]TKI51296.1 hypothetical protein FC752_22240 [Lysinibacillus varians]
MQWKLTKEEYDVLLSYVGCGNFPEADIIVFGNEEGTGGYSVEANAKARVNLYGRDEITGQFLTCLKDGNWQNGFYEPNAYGGRRKVEKYILPIEIKKNKFTKGVFNQTIARLCLAIEDPSKDWFQGSSGSGATEWEEIKQFVSKQLYRPRDGVQTALADWRPLPRPSEREADWPKEEYSAISLSTKNNPYLAFFNNPKRNRKKPSDFSNFQEDMKKRLEILKNLFITSKANVIIGIGGVSGFKKDALELMFEDIKFVPLEFNTADMFTRKNRELQVLTSTISLPNKNLQIFLIPFPEAGNVFKTQEDALNMLKELFVQYINPIFKPC